MPLVDLKSNSSDWTRSSSWRTYFFGALLFVVNDGMLARKGGRIQFTVVIVYDNTFCTRALTDFARISRFQRLDVALVNVSHPRIKRRTALKTFIFLLRQV